jgi:serine/threonine protein kinase/Tol biopolymer transport system component
VWDFRRAAIERNIMAITTVTRMGRYEIHSLLGAGGMGEVYRARDPKLNRDVAIKVLPAAFCADSERLRRFEQEAQAAGALNHPNILAIYDVATHEGAPYVVSELLEGETLRERLKAAALPARKALDYALQIARGLAAAHEKGIVHRDLKPENLFLTKEGRIKILDFGLAKLIEPRGSTKAQTELPTGPLNTDPGTVIGTAGYMSPEQVRGQLVDHRSDIFSFGVILYEMLAGERPFRGESAVETLNAILKEDPPELSAASNTIAPALERIMRHCLEKNPDERFQAARDLAFAIEALSGHSGTSAPRLDALPLLEQPNRRERLAWIIASILLVGFLMAIGFIFAQLRRAPAEANPIRFSVSLPEKTVVTTDVEQHNLSISPDGRRLAFIATSGGQQMVWVRPLEAQPLAGTENAISPFWSPDSRFIGFFADGKLKKIEAGGGAVQTLCDVPEGDNTGTWGRDGVILFDGNSAGFRGIYHVSAAGGAPAPLMKTNLLAPRWAHFLPDGRHFLYSGGSEQSRGKDNGIYVGSLDSTETKLLLQQASSRVEYAPPGYLLYVREGNLLAHPFDATALHTAGEPLLVAERLPYFGTGWGEFSVSGNGVLAYRAHQSITRLVWLDRSGREVGTAGEPAEHYGPELSPDGKKLAVSISDARTGSGGLWIYDLARNTRTRFTFAPTDNAFFVWSPEGRRAAFFSYRGADKPTLYLKELSDAGEGESPLQPGFQIPTDWSSDGRFIVYRENDPKIGGDLWMLPLFGERKPFPFQRTPFNETNARFSPNNRWVAFGSDESGRREVYVRRFEGAAEKSLVSTAGGTQPHWRRDGKELFYVAADKTIMAVSVTATETFKAGVPTPLFKIASMLAEDSVMQVVQHDYDVTADGQRFLVNTGTAEARGLPFTVVVNWTAGLKH